MQMAKRQQVVYLLVWEVETVCGIIEPLGTTKVGRKLEGGLE